MAWQVFSRSKDGFNIYLYKWQGDIPSTVPGIYNYKTGAVIGSDSGSSYVVSNIYTSGTTMSSANKGILTAQIGAPITSSPYQSYMKQLRQIAQIPDVATPFISDISTSSSGWTYTQGYVNISGTSYIQYIRYIPWGATSPAATGFYGTSASRSEYIIYKNQRECGRIYTWADTKRGTMIIDPNYFSYIIDDSLPKDGTALFAKFPNNLNLSGGMLVLGNTSALHPVVCPMFGGYVGGFPSLTAFTLDQGFQLGTSYGDNSQIIADSDYILRPSSNPLPVIYEVSFNNEGSIETYEVTEGSTVPRPTDPVLEGYDFLGWYTSDGVLFDFSTPITEDITLYAHWKETYVPPYINHIIDGRTGESYPLIVRKK